MVESGNGLIAKFESLQDIFVSWLPSEYSILLLGAIAILLILAIKRLFLS